MADTIVHEKAVRILKDAGSLEFDEWQNRLAHECHLSERDAGQSIRDLLKGNPYITIIVKQCLLRLKEQLWRLKMQ